MKEVFGNLKNKRTAKLYYTIFILRRVFIVSIIVFMRDSELYIKIALYLAFQIIALLYSAIVRPFKGVQENIIDILDDTIYVIGIVIAT